MRKPFTPEEAREVFEFAMGERDFYSPGGVSDSARTKLYEEFQYEMPYGVQKARTGDPEQWLGNVLNNYGPDIVQWIAERTEGGVYVPHIPWTFPQNE